MYTLSKTQGKFNKTNILDNIVFGILMINIFYPPFFRGLYFDRELLVAHIITGIIAFLYFINKVKYKEKIIIETKMEYSLFTIITVYFLSTFFAVNTRLAIGELLKYINYYLIFFLVLKLCNSMKKIKITIHTLILSGLIVAVIGLGSALGTFNYNGAYVQGMISSTLQYHNSFGAYMLSMMFLVFPLSNIVAKPYIKFFYYGITYIFYISFIFSYSRGAWVLLPIFLILYLILGKKENRLEMISNFIGSNLGLVVSIKGFNEALKNAVIYKGWAWLVIGVVVSISSAYLIRLFLDKIVNLKINFKVVVPIVVIVFIIIIITFSSTLISYLPESIKSRFSDITLKTHSVSERVTFYKDALKIVKDYPIIGTGGGGWVSLYTIYQSYNYVSTQAHNFFMQLWIETGIIGLIILLVNLALFLYILLKLWTFTQNNKNSLLMSMSISSLVLLVHSFIDFDLSLSALSIVLWSLFALINAFCINEFNSKDFYRFKRLKLNPLVVIIFIFIYVLFSGSLLAGYMYAQKGITELKETKDIYKALQYFEKASEYDMYQATYRVDAANLAKIIGQQTKSKEYTDKSFKYAEKALKLDPYNAKINARVGAIYISFGKIDEGLKLVDNIIKYHPLSPSSYATKANAYMTVANYYINKGNIDKAEEYLKEVVQIEKDFNSIKDKLIRQVEIPKELFTSIDKAKELLNKITRNK